MVERTVEQMDITTGKVVAPIRTVIYGPEGIGKSTAAMFWPKPLFVDLEGGTKQLPVTRTEPTSWAAVLQIVDQLTADLGDTYQTIVFDTADWLERMCSVSVCQEAGHTSIEDFGYGKGFIVLNEEWRRFLDKVKNMQDVTRRHVVFTAHASIRKFERPEEAGAYDRWEMKLSKLNSATMKEWPDMILFYNDEVIVVEQENKKLKAQGGMRVMYSAHHTCWDAKNRYGLPDRMPVPNNAIPAELVAAIGTQTPASAPAPAAEAPKSEAPAPTPEVEKPAAEPAETTPLTKRPPVAPEKVPLLKQLKELMVGAEITEDMLNGEMIRKGVIVESMSPRDYPQATLERIISKWQAVAHNIKNFVAKQA